MRVGPRVRSRILLVWLLPYLLLVMAGGGVHVHLLAGPSSPSAAFAAPGPGSSDSDCPACHWLAASTACLAAPISVMEASPALPASDLRVDVLSYPLPRVHFGRAPPLS